MFTGLVAAVGTVVAVELSGSGSRIEIEAPAIAAELAAGDSVAVNGACLTALHVSDGRFQADVVAETLRRTTLGELTAGGEVEITIEPALARYVVEKGSIALGGVSLTVAAIDGPLLTVALIPETLRATTLGAVVVGSRLNVEVDVLAKHVEKLVAA